MCVCVRQAAMLRLGGYEVDTLTDEQRASIEQMLLDLAAWVDQRKTGAIKYIDFIDAFRILEAPQDGSTEAVPGAIHRRDSARTPSPDSLARRLTVFF